MTVTLPALLGGEPVHPMTAMCYDQLGPALTSGDSDGGWLLLKMLDSMLHGMKPVWDVVMSSPLRPGGWDLFNPYAAKGSVLPWLPWLSQMTGDIYDASTVGAVVGAVSPDQANRDHVARRQQWNRGSTLSIERMILERLPAGASVDVQDRAGSVAHLRVIITTGLALSNPLEAVLYQAVAASIPAGDTFEMAVVTGLSYADIAALLTVDSYAGRQARYPTYDSLPATTEAPFDGTLPPPADFPVAGTTWGAIQGHIVTWAAVQAYGSWGALQAAGSNG